MPRGSPRACEQSYQEIASAGGLYLSGESVEQSIGLGLGLAMAGTQHVPAVDGPACESDANPGSLKNE